MHVHVESFSTYEGLIDYNIGGYVQIHPITPCLEMLVFVLKLHIDDKENLFYLDSDEPNYPVDLLYLQEHDVS